MRSAPIDLIENHPIITETSVSMDSQLIALKPHNYKKPFYWDILKILIICLLSMVFLVSNYALDQKSITNISNIYTHLYYLHYRPSCVRFNLLTLINQIYDNNDCECENLIKEYQEKIEQNEAIIFKTNLPWVKLKNYRINFQQINYHDLCVGLFEAQNDFKEIIGKYLIH